MRLSKKISRVVLLMCAYLLQLFPVGTAHAYIDPGTTGLLSQVLYVLFYGALGIFLYMLRYIKQYFANVKQVVGRWLDRRP